MMATANASEVLFTLLPLHGPAINCLVAFKWSYNAVLMLCIPGAFWRVSRRDVNLPV